MGPGMQALKAAVIVMGVLIVAGTAGLIYMVLHRPGPAGPFAGGLPPVIAAVLQEPVGTHIAGISTTPDRVTIQLQGGGTDRLVLVDPRTGAVMGRISLAH